MESWTDTIPTVSLSMGRSIARAWGSGGRLGAVCSWHAPIRGQGQQNASWPWRGRRGEGSCSYHVHIYSVSYLLYSLMQAQNARSPYLHFLGFFLSPCPSMNDITYGSPGEGYLSAPSPGPARSLLGICAAIDRIPLSPLSRNCVTGQSMYPLFCVALSISTAHRSLLRLG